MGIDELLASDLQGAVIISHGPTSVTVQRPRYFNDDPVPPCDIMVLSWDGDLTEFLDYIEQTCTVIFRDIDRQNAQFLFQRRYRNLGRPCDRTLIKKRA